MGVTHFDRLPLYLYRSFRNGDQNFPESDENSTNYSEFPVRGIPEFEEIGDAVRDFHTRPPIDICDT